MTNHSKTTGFLGLTVILLATTAQAQEYSRPKPPQPPSQGSNQETAQGPKQKLQQIRIQLQTIDKTLTKAQQAAIQKKDIQKMQETYLNEQKKEMLAIAPNQTEEINRRFELFEELVASQRGNEEEELTPEETQNKAKEFQQLDQSLRNIRKKADTKENVSQKQEVYQKNLIEAMKEENEQVEDLLQKRQKLMAQYRQLSIQMQNLLQQRKKSQEKRSPRPQK